MELGFSSLSLFMKSFEEMLEIATKDGFDLIEILCEGPYWPRNLLNQENNSFEKIKEFNPRLKNMDLDIFDSYNIKLMLHSPTIDLNPASMNEGIRKETEKQTKEALDLASKIGAIAITTHPGLVHRREERIRNLALEFAIDTLTSCQNYAEDLGVTFSVENMPNKENFLANSPQEHSLIVDSVDCSATIDWGHANTYEHPYEFLNISKISYFHLNDNNGKKDSHLPLGEGTADFSLSFLKTLKKGIIELNNYEDVLKGKKYIYDKLKSGS
jgi:sugar phosphate isomerase/epimerase